MYIDSKRRHARYKQSTFMWNLSHLYTHQFLLRSILQTNMFFICDNHKAVLDGEVCETTTTLVHYPTSKGHLTVLLEPSISLPYFTCPPSLVVIVFAAWWAVWFRHWGTRELTIKVRRRICYILCSFIVVF